MISLLAISGKLFSSTAIFYLLFLYKLFAPPSAFLPLVSCYHSYLFRADSVSFGRRDRVFEERWRRIGSRKCLQRVCLKNPIRAERMKFAPRRASGRRS